MLEGAYDAATVIAISLQREKVNRAGAQVEESIRAGDARATISQNQKAYFTEYTKLRQIAGRANPYSKLLEAHTAMVDTARQDPSLQDFTNSMVLFFEAAAAVKGHLDDLSEEQADNETNQ